MKHLIKFIKSLCVFIVFVVMAFFTFVDMSFNVLYFLPFLFVVFAYFFKVRRFCHIAFFVYLWLTFPVGGV